MRLSNLIPHLPEHLVACLQASGIRTEMDLLFSASTFDIYRRLPAGTVTLQELLDYTSLAAELCSASGVSGRDLIQLEEEAQSKDVELQSGNAELDAFLRGLGGRRIIELSGDRGSGKSVLALNVLLQHLASNPAHTAIWVDTTGEFSPERAAQILEAKQLPATVLERFQVSLAFDLDTMQTLLENLKQLNNGYLRLFVIDSITTLLGPLLSAVSAQGHAMMTDFMRQLQDCVQSSGATVIVVNNTAGNGTYASERKPSLGPSFQLLTDTTLWLQAVTAQEDEDEDSTLRSIRVFKSRSIAAGTSSTFRIRQNTILPTPCTQ